MIRRTCGSHCLICLWGRNPRLPCHRRCWLANKDQPLINVALGTIKKHSFTYVQSMHSWRFARSPRTWESTDSPWDEIEDLPCRDPKPNWTAHDILCWLALVPYHLPRPLETGSLAQGWKRLWGRSCIRDSSWKERSFRGLRRALL